MLNFPGHVGLSNGLYAEIGPWHSVIDPVINLVPPNHTEVDRTWVGPGLTSPLAVVGLS